MAFSLTSKQAELRGSWLVATVRKDDGSWTEARLNLNDHIGNNDGAFDITMGGWYNSALDWSCHLHGTVLEAQLKALSGEYAPETSINLDLFIRNRDGSLEFQKLGDSLFLYTACLTLENARLRGLVAGRDGKFHISTINLDDNYGNINGRFESDERHFSRSGRNFGLEHDLHAIRLTGEIMDYAGEHHKSEIDISECVMNHQGRLAFYKPDESSERDGDHWTTVIAEPIPLLGSAIVGLYRSTGQSEEEDRFYRQIASQTNSATITIGVAIGAFIGRASRSPVIGIVVGSKLGNSPDVFDDKTLNTIEDPETRGQIQEAKLGLFVLETLRDLIATNEAAPAAELLGSALTDDIDSWAKGFVAWLERQSIPPLPEFSLYSMLKSVYARLQGETVEGWDKSLELLADTKKRIEALQLEPEPEPEPQPEPELEAEAETPEVPKVEEPPTSELVAEAPLTNGLTNGDAKPAESTTDASKADLPNGTKSDEPQQTTVSSSPSSSNPKLASNGGSGSKSGSTKDKASVCGNGPPRKWHSVLGVTMFRGWSKHRQPKAI